MRWMLTAGAALTVAAQLAASPPDQVSTLPLAAGRAVAYSLSARVRPLLFWIGKDDVGEARLWWKRTRDGRAGYELLIGSDPARTPRRINRWGYIRELATADGVETFGLMTEADEATLEEAKSVAGALPDGTRAYKVIHATAGASRAVSAVHGVALPERLTLHDLDAATSSLPAPRIRKEISLPYGVEPGFLFAMSGLIREQVDAVAITGQGRAGARRTFVYAAKLYDVSVAESRVLAGVTVCGQEYQDVIESEFITRRRGDARPTKYRVLYGARGPLREVPIRAVYRPYWWFEAEVVRVGSPNGRCGAG
jgi:hypothetical protein